jgi:nitrate reductase NapD
MNIVGILIGTLPEHTDYVLENLKQLGIEVHGVNELGQIVVTLEEELDEIITQKITQLQQIQGVLTAAMVYHQIEN